MQHWKGHTVKLEDIFKQLEAGDDPAWLWRNTLPEIVPDSLKDEYWKALKERRQSTLFRKVHMNVMEEIYRETGL
jgi:hypothetical protein